MSDPTTPPAGNAAPPPTDAGAVSAASPAPTEDLGALREQMLVDRFDAVAARSGIAEDYTEVALELFRKTGKEPTRANLGTFCADLKKSRPALFGPQPATTAPTPTQAVPSAPAPGSTSTPYQQWRSLITAGRRAEAEVFYHQHRGAIARSMG